MSDLMKLAQTVAGPFVPVAFIALLCTGVIRLGRYLDAHLRTNTRDAYVDYLRNGGLSDTSKALVDVAANAVDIVFGPRHLSLRCVAMSAVFTIGSIAFYVALSAILSFSISLLHNVQVNLLLKSYWSFPFKIGLPSICVWLAWSLVVDYLSLFKTRLLVRMLRKATGFAPLFCVADFAIGFGIYVGGIVILSLLPMFPHMGWLAPPSVSLEIGAVMSMLAILYGRAVLPNIDSMLAAKGQFNAQAAALVHSDAPQTMIAILFLIQLVPFATIGSDLFYASMMPSIWLWLFLGSVFVAKLIAGIGAYLQFAFSRFKKTKQSLEVTASLLNPVLVSFIVLATLWPYGLAVLVMMGKAFLELIGLLAQHLQSTITPR